jgi:hypothetical protein
MPSWKKKKADKAFRNLMEALALMGVSNDKVEQGLEKALLHFEDLMPNEFGINVKWYHDGAIVRSGTVMHGRGADPGGHTDWREIASPTFAVRAVSGGGPVLKVILWQGYNPARVLEAVASASYTGADVNFFKITDGQTAHQWIKQKGYARTGRSWLERVSTYGPEYRAVEFAQAGGVSLRLCYPVLTGAPWCQPGCSAVAELIRRYGIAVIGGL